MIIKEFYTTREDGVELYRSYSDKGLLIRKVGTEEIYSEAIDISTALYEYEETDIPIEENNTDEATEAVVNPPVETEAEGEEPVEA